VPGWFKDTFLEIAEDVDEASKQGKHVLLFFQLNTPVLPAVNDLTGSSELSACRLSGCGFRSRLS
jgi:hypothetical protein